MGIKYFYQVKAIKLMIVDTGITLYIIYFINKNFDSKKIVSKSVSLNVDLMRKNCFRSPLNRELPLLNLQQL